jgi:hypothetical protein
MSDPIVRKMLLLTHEIHRIVDLLLLQEALSIKATEYEANLSKLDSTTLILAVSPQVD